MMKPAFRLKKYYRFLAFYFSLFILLLFFGSHIISDELGSSRSILVQHISVVVIGLSVIGFAMFNYGKKSEMQHKLLLRNQRIVQDFEKLYDDLFAKSPVPKYVSDRTTLKFLNVNEAALKLYGYTREEFLQLSVFDLRLPEYHELLYDFEKQPTLGLQKLNKTPQVKKDGSIVWVEVSIDEIRFQGQAAFLSTVKDLTEKLHAEEQIRRSEELYKSLFNNSPDCIFISDFESNVLDMNDTAAAVYGYTKDKLVGHSALKLVYEPDRAEVQREIKQPQTGNMPFLHRHVTRHGEVLHMETTVHLIDYKQEQAALVIAHNVTEKVHAEEALKQSEAKFRSLIERSWDGILLLGKTGRIMYAAPSVEWILGYSAEEMKRIHPGSLTHPRDLPLITSLTKELLEKSGQSSTVEFRMKHKTGKWKWLQSTITNMIHVPGVNALVYNYQDITERKENEKSLMESEANLKAILENTNAAFQLIDADLNVAAFNTLAEEWTVQQTGKMLQVGTPYSTYLNDDRRIAVSQIFKKVLQGEDVAYEAKGYQCDKWFFVNMQRIVSKNNKVLGICIGTMDITDRKNAEDKIRMSEELYRSLFDKTPLPIYVVDKETLKYLEVSEAAVQVYGYTKEEFLQLTVFDVRVPEDHHQLKLLQKGDSSLHKTFHIQHRKKDGSTMIVDLTLETINYKGREAYLAIVKDITETLRLQQQLQNEKLNRQIEITQATVSGQEKERHELGKELHDNVNQILASAKLYLETAIAMPENQPQFVNSSKELINNAIQEIRKICKSLVPPSLGDLTLKEALRDLLDPMKITNKKVRLLAKSLKEDVLNNDLKISMYRIAQEQINNILKYAQASEITIQIKQTDTEVYLLIEDDGKGFDVTKKRTGIGITNIINRAALYNGTVYIDSSPGNGCRLNVNFKLMPSKHPSGAAGSMICHRVLQRHDI